MYAIIKSDFRSCGKNFSKGEIYLVHFITNENKYVQLTNEKREFALSVPKELCVLTDMTLNDLIFLSGINLKDRLWS